MQKKKEKKKKERKKEKETTRKKLGPLHSHETLRGRGRSCWLKADKKFASRAKRKRNEECAYMCEQTWHHHGRLKQFWLQQCTMLESAVLTCIGLLRFQLHFTCGATLFLSFEVRRSTCCDSAVDFTGKKVVSIVAIFKKSKSPVIFTCLSKESTLPGVFVDFSVGVNLVASLFLVGLFWITKASERKKNKSVQKNKNALSLIPWSRYHWWTNVSPFYTERERERGGGGERRERERACVNRVHANDSRHHTVHP